MSRIGAALAPLAATPDDEVAAAASAAAWSRSLGGGTFATLAATPEDEEVTAAASAESCARAECGIRNMRNRAKLAFHIFGIEVPVSVPLFPTITVHGDLSYTSKPNSPRGTQAA